MQYDKLRGKSVFWIIIVQSIIIVL